MMKTIHFSLKSMCNVRRAEAETIAPKSMGGTVPTGRDQRTATSGRDGVKALLASLKEELSNSAQVTTTRKSSWVM